ncbi:MAG: amino acid permease [Anaerolineae bacterium]|nr:amino acid permease [Gemmatimonadaceae bacterium]
MSSSPAPVPSAALSRTLNLRDLILIVVGTVIGSGIFIVPASVLAQTGGEIGPALLVWLIAGILSLLGALTYGEMGAANPNAGGLYSYIRDAFGPMLAFLFGWTMFFVISSGSLATLAVAFTGYLGEFTTLSRGMSRGIAVVMIAVVTLINVLGTRKSAGVQGWTTAIKSLAIVLISIVLISRGTGFSSGDPQWWPARVESSLMSGVGLAMIGVLWAYEGWQYVTFSAGETRDPRRTFPLGITIGTALLIGIYLLANVGYISALGPDAAAQSQRIAAQSVTVIMGPAAGKIIAGIILISMFSAANGLVLTAPRLYYSMARDGLFFGKLAEVHPRFGTPAFAIVAGSAWAILLAISGTFEQLLTYVVFAGWIFYGLGALAIFSYRRKAPNAARPFSVPGYPITPILFVASAAAIVLNTLMTQPGRALIGLGAVAIGVPAYFFWRAKGRRSGVIPASE